MLPFPNNILNVSVIGLIIVPALFDPKVLLTDKDNLKKETTKYLENFKNHPYIFNLGHGVLPETNPNMVDYLVKMVKDF